MNCVACEHETKVDAYLEKMLTDDDFELAAAELGPIVVCGPECKHSCGRDPEGVGGLLNA